MHILVLLEFPERTTFTIPTTVTNSHMVSSTTSSFIHRFLLKRDGILTNRGESCFLWWQAEWFGWFGVRAFIEELDLCRESMSNGIASGLRTKSAKDNGSLG